jgi:phage shock protein PspC (stress-responsive transcriptional regulator)
MGGTALRKGWMISARHEFPPPHELFDSADAMQAAAFPEQAIARPGMFRAGKGTRVAGVCQALARELDYPTWIIRMAFVVGLFCGASPLVVLAYALGWIMIPYLPGGHSRFDPMPLWIARPVTKVGGLFESAAEAMDRWV